MAAVNTISSDKLARLIDTPRCPALLDVRPDEDWRREQRLIPGAVRRDATDVAAWAPTFTGRGTIVICGTGGSVGHGVGAWLRHAGVAAEVLEGGHAAWTAAGLPTVPEGKLPPRDHKGRTVWVTRSRPKVDRVACPWLIRRFVDPSAVFLFVAPAEVTAVAERFGGAPLDIEDTFWSHRGDRCTFDTMVEELGLSTEPLERLATMVRGADTGRLDLMPEAAGLLAVSLGLSRIHAGDLEQVDAGMAIYNALYRWCRDATGETHNWPTNKPERGR